MPKYEVLEEIARLNKRGESSLCLDKVRFAGGEVAYDLRVWYFRPYGESDPGRGITLRGDDLRALYEALHRHFTGERIYKAFPKKVETPEDSVYMINDTPL